MYNQIWSPLKQEFVPTLSTDGRQALKMFVNSFMTGGALSDEHATNIGNAAKEAASTINRAISDNNEITTNNLADINETLSNLADKINTGIRDEEEKAAIKIQAAVRRKTAAADAFKKSAKPANVGEVGDDESKVETQNFVDNDGRPLTF